MKKIKCMNMHIYHAKRATKATKFKKWKHYNELHLNDAPTNQSPNNNKNDIKENIGHDDGQQRKCQTYI